MNKEQTVLRAYHILKEQDDFLSSYASIHSISKTALIRQCINEMKRKVELTGSHTIPQKTLDKRLVKKACREALWGYDLVTKQDLNDAISKICQHLDIDRDDSVIRLSYPDSSSTTAAASLSQDSKAKSI